MLTTYALSSRLATSADGKPTQSAAEGGGESAVGGAGGVRCSQAPRLYDAMVYEFAWRIVLIMRAIDVCRHAGGGSWEAVTLRSRIMSLTDLRATGFLPALEFDEV